MKELNDALALRKTNSSVHQPRLDRIDEQRTSQDENPKPNRRHDFKNLETANAKYALHEHKLQDRLHLALIDDPCTNQRFVPRSDLNKIITQNSVNHELSKPVYLAARIRSRFARVRINILAEYESALQAQVGSTLDYKNQADTAGFQKIFAILLLIRRPKRIWSFVREGVCDADLPLLKNNRDGTMELLRRDTKKTPLKCLSKIRDVCDFYIRQWDVLPVFLGSEDKNKASKFKAWKSQPCPFLHWEDLGRHGGSGRVYQAKVHPSHHSFEANEVSIATLAWSSRNNVARYTKVWLRSKGSTSNPRLRTEN